MGVFLDEELQSEYDARRTRILEYQAIVHNSRYQRKEAILKASIVDVKRPINT